MHPTFMVSFTDETGNTIKVKIEIKIDSRYQRQDNQYIYYNTSRFRQHVIVKEWWLIICANFGSETSCVC